MATTSRGTTSNKEKKTISSSHNPTTSSKASSSVANGKAAVPNYLKPTLSSKNESFKYVVKKNNNNVEETNKQQQQPALLRRRSFDHKPQSPSPSQSSRAHKALVSPGPRDRNTRTITTVRSSSFSSPKIKPIVDRISKTPNATKSQSPFSKNAANKASTTSTNNVTVPCKNKETTLKKPSTSKSSSNITSTPETTTTVNNHQENKQVRVQEDHKVEEVLQAVTSDPLPQSGEDSEKKITSASRYESVDMTKISEDKNEEINGSEDIIGDQCQEEIISTNTNNNNEDEQQVISCVVGDDEIKQLVQDDHHTIEEDDHHINNAIDPSSTTKETTRDDENIKVEETFALNNEDDKSESGNFVEEVKLAKIIVAPSKPHGVSSTSNTNHGKKESSPAYNDVIEETASKLLEKRKNKVKALVGAFETVIDYESAASK